MKKSTLGAVFVFVILLVCLVLGFNNLNTAQDDEDFKRVEENLTYSIIACYSIEGSYPEDLDYLKNNYGLYFNEDLYQIHFRYLGDNLMPEYKVFKKGIE